MEKIDLYSRLESTVAHSDELEREMGDETFKIFTKANANLARHRRTGNHRITQTKGKVDHFVNLEGDASLAVEEGWFADNGRWVEGLHVLRDAIEGA